MILEYLKTLVAHEERKNPSTLIQNGDEPGCFKVRASVGDAFQCVRVQAAGCCRNVSETICEPQIAVLPSQPAAGETDAAPDAPSTINDEPPQLPKRKRH